jgi:branched-chain amino acid transport system substrate-binding protein
MFKDAGIGLDLIPIAAGTADMTPQMQKLTSSNPNGVVFVLGNDAFCIAAFNGLRTAGFKGTITTLPSCISDATRTAVPADFLKGMQISASSPTGNPKDPSMKQLAAVMKKYGASDANLNDIAVAAMFETLASINVATKDLKGEVTPQSVIAAAKAMPWSVQPGTGGLHFRCNGKADPDQPAVCSSATLAATLNSEGNATKYTPVADTEIPA